MLIFVDYQTIEELLVNDWTMQQGNGISIVILRINIQSNANQNQIAENKLQEDVTKIEGQDAAKIKGLLIKEQAGKELKPLTDRVNMVSFSPQLLFKD